MKIKIYYIIFVSLISCSNDFLENRNFIEQPELIRKINYENIYSVCAGKIYGDFLYLIDINSQKIHKLSLTENYKHLSFGKKGHGPGEFINAIDLCEIGNNIYIACTSKRTIEIYSKKGEYLNSFKLGKINPSRLIGNNEDSLLIVFDSAPYNNRYNVFDVNGNFIGNFGTALSDKSNSFFGNESDVAKINDSSFIEISMRLGIMGLFCNNKLLQKENTIDGNVKYKQKYKNRAVIPNDNNIPRVREVSVNDSILVSKVILKKQKKIVYDIYKLNNLDYQASFMLPQFTFELFLWKDKIITINENDNTICLWKLK